MDWNFKALNDSDFSIRLDAVADKGLVNKILLKSKVALQRKKGIAFDGKADGVQNIEIPHDYLKFVEVSLRGIISKIDRQIKSDGIEILNYGVDKATLTKTAFEDWNITVNITGIYADKRK